MVEKEELLKELLSLSSLLSLHQWDQMTFWLVVSRKNEIHIETLKCSHNLGGQVELKGERRILCSRLRFYKQDFSKFSHLFEESANKGHLSGLPIPDEAS